VVLVTYNRLVFAGEAIVDLIMRVPVLPGSGAAERGGDLLAESSSVQVGGGFNVMAAAVRQGVPVVYAGGHGTGPWGDLVRSALAAEGVGILRPPDPDLDTGFDVAFVEPDGERTFVTSLGAETHPGGWDTVRVVPGDVVYVSGYGLVPAPSADARAVPAPSGPGLGSWAAALPAGVLLFADPGPLVADIPAATLEPVLARSDWWSCNLREAALLTGTNDPAAAARALLCRAGRAGVLVRAGSAGCVLATAVDSVVSVPAPVVEVADTTGAGDAHAGVFIGALVAGLPPVDAARRANAAAALAVTRHGPATAPDHAELDEFLRQWRALGLGREVQHDGHAAGRDDDPRRERGLAPRGDLDRHRSARWDGPRRRGDQYVRGRAGHQGDAVVRDQTALRDERERLRRRPVADRHQ
jgi:sugar/nucleoside kinase (ribokinase family)